MDLLAATASDTSSNTSFHLRYHHGCLNTPVDMFASNVHALGLPARRRSLFRNRQSHSSGICPTEPASASVPPQAFEQLPPLAAVVQGLGVVTRAAGPAQTSPGGELPQQP